MTLRDLLFEKKSAILDGWLDRILEVYPAESRAFFRKNPDPFSNPVGSSIREGMEKLYQEILQPPNVAQSGSSLDPIVRIRAVENIPPSQAIAFVPLLKEAIREALGDQILESVSYQEWLTLDGRIDRIALQAFDIYMECREKIYQLKIKELKDRPENPFGEDR